MKKFNKNENITIDEDYITQFGYADLKVGQIYRALTYSEKQSFWDADAEYTCDICGIPRKTMTQWNQEDVCYRCYTTSTQYIFSEEFLLNPKVKVISLHDHRFVGQNHSNGWVSCSCGLDLFEAKYFFWHQQEELNEQLKEQNIKVEVV